MFSLSVALAADLRTRTLRGLNSTSTLAQLTEPWLPAPMLPYSSSLLPPDCSFYQKACLTHILLGSPPWTVRQDQQASPEFWGLARHTAFTICVLSLSRMLNSDSLAGIFNPYSSTGPRHPVMISAEQFSKVALEKTVLLFVCLLQQKG